MRIELLYVENCPNWKTADHRLRKVAGARGLRVAHRLITTAEEAEQSHFLGSPTILIDGRDPFASGNEAFSLSCRLFSTPDGPAGSPTLEQLEAAVDR